jgi:hypothetical protein
MVTWLLSWCLVLKMVGSFGSFGQGILGAMVQMRWDVGEEVRVKDTRC